MLLDQNPGREGLGRITLAYRHSRLRQDRAPVVLLVYQVHRGPRLARAAGQYRFVHPPTVHTPATERRQQCRMHVEDLSPIGLDHSGWHQPDVTGQDEEIDIMRLELPQPLGGVVGRLEPDRCDTPASGSVQGGRIGPVTHDKGDANVGIARERLAERLEIAASAGGGYGNLHGHREKVTRATGPA